MRLPLIIVELLARVQQRKVLLKIDPKLHSKIPIEYASNEPVEFSFSVFDLLGNVGFCKNCSPTKTIKFPLALDFLDLLVANDANELRILINDDETIEDKQAISKNAGEGLSLLIAEELYGIARGTIKRIKRRANESKPDFQGFTPDLKIVWEAKGSTDPITQYEINHAKDQKKKEPANLAFASLASLKAESITEVDVEIQNLLHPKSGN